MNNPQDPDVFETAGRSLNAVFQDRAGQPPRETRPRWGVVEGCPCGRPHCITAIYVAYEGNGAWLVPQGWTVTPDERNADTTWTIVDGDGETHRLWAREA